MTRYSEYDGLGLAELVRTRQVSPEELLETALSRADSVQSQINCFAALYPDIAREQIKAGGLEGPYAGVPFVVKDLGVEVKGAPVTSGSRAFKGNVASRDSTLVERFRKAGLVFFGATTTPEFGLTLTTESTLYGQSRNPWDTTRITGGSSGGAAAAVAAGVLPVAHASDGGGSIRIPAACCGVFGLKPSRGRMPMGPAKTEGWNGLSTVGVVSRTVRDTAALLDLTHGPETGSRYAAPAPAPALSYLSEVERDPRPLRIAYWPVAPNGTKPDADAAEGLANTVKLLEQLGHTVVEAAPVIDGEAIAKAGLFTISANIAALVEERGIARGT
ncbi:MAG: amidase, partial [Hyphomonas sp. 34-62-18]